MGALREAGRDTYRGTSVSSMLFPVFGTGPGGGKFDEHAELCIHATVEYMESNHNPITDVYFYCWSDVAVKNLLAVIEAHPGLEGRVNRRD